MGPADLRGAFNLPDRIQKPFFNLFPLKVLQSEPGHELVLDRLNHPIPHNPAGNEPGGPGEEKQAVDKVLFNVELEIWEWCFVPDQFIHAHHLGLIGFERKPIKSKKKCPVFF
jgi:hypothetical protein